MIKITNKNKFYYYLINSNKKNNLVLSLKNWVSIKWSKQNNYNLIINLIKLRIYKKMKIKSFNNNNNNN